MMLWSQLGPGALPWTGLLPSSAGSRGKGTRSTTAEGWKVVKSHGTGDAGLKRHLWILVQKCFWARRYLDLLTAFLSRIPDS